MNGIGPQRAPSPLPPREGTVRRQPAVSKEAVLSFLGYLPFTLDISQDIPASSCETVTYS